MRSIALVAAVIILGGMIADALWERQRHEAFWRHQLESKR